MTQLIINVNKRKSPGDLVKSLLGASLDGRRQQIIGSILSAGYIPFTHSFSSNDYNGENILARLNSNYGKNRIVTAHYDGLGGYDNAGGVAVVLEIMRKMKNSKREDVSFLFTDAEERGQLGARAFLNHYGNTDIVANVNIDGAGVGEEIIEVDTSRIESILPSIIGNEYEVKLRSDSDVFREFEIPSVHYATLPKPEIEQFESGQIPQTWLRVLYDRDGIEDINDNDIKKAAEKIMERIPRINP